MMVSRRGRSKTIAGAVALAMLAVSFASTPANAATGSTTRVSVASGGAQAKKGADQNNSAISADGRYVAFTSVSGNLVPGDTNNVVKPWNFTSAPGRDVFVHDRATTTTTRVSVNSAGAQAKGGENWFNVDISGDGRYVVFDSYATNLVAGDTNGELDIFVHDRLTATTTRASVSSSGAQANDSSSYPRISADGRYVAFLSQAKNLILGDNGGSGAFLHDRLTGATTLESRASDGRAIGAMPDDLDVSGDGRFVVFESFDQATPQDDPDANNSPSDVILRDRVTGTTAVISVSSTGLPGNKWSAGASISDDGRYVAFSSLADTLVPGDANLAPDVFLRDWQAGTTTRVSQSSLGVGGHAASGFGFISADGRYVAFASAASNLVLDDTNGGTDVFVHDRLTNETTRASLSASGEQVNDGCGCTSEGISGNGAHVAFMSPSSNVVPGDTNGKPDIFVRDR